MGRERNWVSHLCRLLRHWRGNRCRDEGFISRYSETNWKCDCVDWASVEKSMLIDMSTIHSVVIMMKFSRSTVIHCKHFLRIFIVFMFNQPIIVIQSQSGLRNARAEFF